MDSAILDPPCTDCFCGQNSAVTEANQRTPSREQLRAFAARRWDLVADEKLAFLADRYRREGAAGSREAAHSMARQWAKLHPAGPTPEARRDDLEHHIALKKKLDATAHVIGRR
jgi:hypothetical protein